MTTTKPITLIRGKTFTLPILWETTPIVRKAITAISLATGAPRLTVTGHGVPDGWRVYCYGILGTTELNMLDPAKVRNSDYVEATVIDANTIELNSINAAGFKAYKSGGFLAYNAPHDLSGYVVRAKVKDKVGGTVLLSTEASDSPLDLITATVDDTAKRVTISVSATTTASLAWKKGIWDVEAESPGGAAVYQLVAPSEVAVADEVTTNG